MAISVENNWTGTSSVGSVTSWAKALPSTVGAGSLIVAVTTIYAPGETVTFSDGVNTWTTITPTSSNSSVYETLAIGFAINTSSGSRTVTASSGTSCDRAVAVASYTGQSASPLDGTPTAASNATGTSSTVAPGAITTTGAGILIAAAVYTGAGPLTAATGYTGTNFALSGVYPFGVQEKITTGAVTENPGFNYSDGFWLCCGVAFKSDAGGASVAPIAAYYNSLRANA